MVTRLALTNASMVAITWGTVIAAVHDRELERVARLAAISAVPNPWPARTPLASTNASTVAVTRAAFIAAVHEPQLERVARGH